ncbi:hypothetical protein GCM10022409_33510 [Hymenobacter glaciei]|uniref:MORN repeat variant n=1 Tax=Hymenobacter glaciei TaxID=877209 RepID=A0ABP7UJA1_9BACT
MLVGAARHGWAQTPAAPAAGQATLAQCVRIIKGDSVLLFYDATYALTPPACAPIRRFTRITASGDFNGETRDYDARTQKLRARLHYRAGKREGRYETYFPNGQLAVQGTFAQGKPAGTWQFWYANGQQRQTLAWTDLPAPRLRILAYWDSTGQQGVANGNGVWHDVLPMLHSRFGGPVLNGLAQGVWENRAATTNKLLTTEVYEQGIFRGGKALDGIGGRYKDRPLLEPQVGDLVAAAEGFRLGATCEMRQAAYQADAARAEQMRNALPPTPAGDPSSFVQTVLRQLSESNQTNDWEIIADGREFVVEAMTDEKGYLHLLSGQSGGGFITALTQVVSGLPAWRPATYNSKPVPGLVQLVISKRGSVLNMSYRTRVDPVALMAR